MELKAYKWCAVFLLFILLREHTTAQNLSFDINKVCNKSTNCNPFQNNYACAGGVLRATHGSPAFYLPATNTTKQIELQAEITSNGVNHGEGFTLEFVFKAGTQYQVTIRHSGRPETGSILYPNLIVALTNSPNRRDDGCDLGSLPATSVYTSFQYTVSKQPTTSSFTITPNIDIGFLWLRSNPVQVTNTGLLIFSIEIKDFSAALPPPPPPGNYGCDHFWFYNFCHNDSNWEGDVDVRTSNPLTLNCSIFHTGDPDLTHSRKFSSTTIILAPGFQASSEGDHYFGALASNYPCQQPLRRGVADPPEPVAQNLPQINEPDHITIYPTVGNGHVIIKGNSENLSGAFIIVNDQLGREVYKKRNGNGQTTITCDLHALSKGLYFIRVQKANTVITKKIIIN